MRVIDYQGASGTVLQDAVGYLADKRRALYAAPLSNLRVDPDSGHLLNKDLGLDLPLTKFSARRLATYVHVPTAWALRQPTDVVAGAMNYFLERGGGNLQVVTENDRCVVGFLPEGHVPVAGRVVVERLGEERDGFTPVHWTHDEFGLTVRSVTDRLTVEPKLGDTVQLGVDLMLRDDRDGLGVRGVAYRLVCMNGAIAEEASAVRRMLRREGWRDPAIRTDLAIDSFNEVSAELVGTWSALQQAARHQLSLADDDDTERVRVLSRPLRVLGLPGRFTESVSDALRGEDQSLFGVYNAVTRLGRDAVTRQTRELFERAGYRVASRLDRVVESLEVPA